MKKKAVVTAAIIAAIVLVSGCLIWKLSRSTSDVSEGATKVATAMATCPNSDLFSMDAVTIIGSGGKAEDTEKTKAAAAQIEAN